MSKTDTPAGREIAALLLKSELAKEQLGGKAPCTPDCAERTITCHTTCKKYLGWKDELAARKRAVERRRREENEAAEFYRTHQKRVDKYKRGR